VESTATYEDFDFPILGFQTTDFQSVKLDFSPNQVQS